MRFLKDRMSSISSDLHEEILKLNKSYVNRIIQIIPCKTAFTEAATEKWCSGVLNLSAAIVKRLEISWERFYF